MKTLLIMRPAEARPGNESETDFERSLSSLGLRTAPLVGCFVYENGFRPNLIISSTAKRAKQTAVLIKETTELRTKIEFAESLFEAGSPTLLRKIAESSDEFETVLLIGHIPGIEGLIKILTDEIHQMSEASIAKINLQIEQWRDIEEKCGQLEMLLKAADLTEDQQIEILPKN